MLFKAMVFAAVAAVSFTASASAAELTIINNSKETITELKVAPSSDANWTSLDDVLKGASIAPGATGTVTGIEPGKWDLQVTDSDNKSCEVLNVTFEGDDMKWTINDGDIAGCE